MYKLKVYDKQLVEAVDVQNIADASLENVQDGISFLTRGLFKTNSLILSGMEVTEKDPLSQYMGVASGILFINGVLVENENAYDVDLFDEAPHPTLPKIATVCVSIIEENVSNESRWFIDDSGDVPFEYQQNVDTLINVRLEFTVFYGSPNAVPQKPVIPNGYVPFFDMFIGANAPYVTESNLTMLISSIDGVVFNDIVDGFNILDGTVTENKLSIEVQDKLNFGGGALGTNVDGGTASSLYTLDQVLDGGEA